MNPVVVHTPYGDSPIDFAFMELTARMPVFILASLRVALVFAGMPAPFGAVAPMRIRTAMTVLVTFAVMLPQWHTMPKLPLDLSLLGKAAVFEFFIGMLLGLTVRLTMTAAETAGTLMGTTMGMGFAGSIDPSYGEEVLATGFLLESIAALMFFSLGCHHVLLSAVAASFHAAPIGAPINAAWRGSALSIGTDLIARGLQIAAPVIGSMFIVQVGTAFVSRTASRVHLFAFAFSISAGAGMVILWAAAPAVCTAVVRLVQHLPDVLAGLGTH